MSVPHGSTNVALNLHEDAPRGVTGPSLRRPGQDGIIRLGLDRGRHGPFCHRSSRAAQKRKVKSRWHQARFYRSTRLDSPPVIRTILWFRSPAVRVLGGYSVQRLSPTKMDDRTRPPVSSGCPWNRWSGGWKSDRFVGRFGGEKVCSQRDESFGRPVLPDRSESPTFLLITGYHQPATNIFSGLQVREKPRLVRDGPFAYVRHPIYTQVSRSLFTEACPLQSHAAEAFLLQLLPLSYSGRTFLSTPFSSQLVGPY